MSHQFVAHFVSNRRPRKGSESLMNIRQREGESIRAYINRFNVAALEVQNLDQSVAMAALKGGLQKNDLLFSLEKKYPKNFADLLARAEGYTRAEEAFKMKDEETTRERQAGDSSKPAVEKRSREARPHSRSPPGHKRAHTPPRVRRQRSLDHRVRRDSPSGRFRNYAPLNASKTQVLMEVREQLPRPERMRTHPGKCNPNKFCLYHRDHGHDTEECIQLRDEIEELIRRGRLDRFIRRRPEGREDRPRALPQPEPPRRKEQSGDRPPIGTIDSIVGGPQGGADLPRP
ncbi:uncharacterized protein [Elaeis guineensis]|uniref:uncharacterized protein n=1 Tax=Elaeis guineensis var. tenera TaxID=51953 RepID=UPI003C6D90BE